MRRSDKPEVSLPTKKSEPIKTPGETITFLFGEPKIGKTSLASQFEDALFLMFEPGGKGLRIYQEPVTTWAEFIAYVDLIEKDKQFKTVVVDIIDKCYKRCSDTVCKEAGIKHPSDMPYSKGWDLVQNEFTKQIDRLTARKGVVFISHATIRDIPTRTGRIYSRIEPTISGKAGQYVIGISNILAFYGYYGDTRYITVQGSDEVQAGTQLDENFWTSSKKKRVHSISVGENKQDAYENFVKAFKNEQKDENNPAKKAVITPTRQKIGKR